MTPFVSLRVVLLGLMLAGGSAPGAFSADRKGTMDPTCCNTTFRLHHLRQQEGSREIILELRNPCPPYNFNMWVSAGWLKVDAKVCESNSDRCETATSASLRLDAVTRSGRRVSGAYRVDFASGGHEEGKFIAKYHHKGPKIECL
jgi:hypothetical protein